MSNYLRNKYAVTGKSRSGGSPIVYILLFVAFSVVLIGLAIAYEKEQRKRLEAEEVRDQLSEYHDEAATPNGGDPIALRGSGNGSVGSSSGSSKNVRHDDDYYIKHRGLTPNKTAKKPEVLYVGRKDYDRYHRLDCKYGLKHIDKSNLVEFSSASEAREKGYIPCKICKPPAMDEGAPIAVSGDEGPDEKPEKPAPKPSVSKPVSRPVKDVALDFTYNVVERHPNNDEGVLIVEYVVEVDNILSKEEALDLAQKVVAGELKKGKVNAVNVTIRKRVTGRKGFKWFCIIDWAPWGNLTRAYEINRGDYRNHQFSILMQGIYKR